MYSSGASGGTGGFNFNPYALQSLYGTPVFSAAATGASQTGSSKLPPQTAAVLPIPKISSSPSGGAPNAMNATRNASFAAALRKLAKQVEDPAAPNHGLHNLDNTAPSPAASLNASPRAQTPSSRSHVFAHPPRTSVNSPPVVAIAPQQQQHHHSHERSKNSERSTNSHGNGEVKAENVPRDKVNSVATSQIEQRHHREEGRNSSEPVLSRPRSKDSESASHARSTPAHMANTSSHEDPTRGFQPYRPGTGSAEELLAAARAAAPPLPSSLVGGHFPPGMDPAAYSAALAAYPHHLPPHGFPQPPTPFRMDDMLERYRASLLQQSSLMAAHYPHLAGLPPGALSLPPFGGLRYPGLPDSLLQSTAAGASLNGLGLVSPNHRSPGAGMERPRSEEGLRREREDRERREREEKEAARQREDKERREKREREEREKAEKEKAERQRQERERKERDERERLRKIEEEKQRSAFASRLDPYANSSYPLRDYEEERRMRIQKDRERHLDYIRQKARGSDGAGGATNGAKEHLYRPFDPAPLTNGYSNDVDRRKLTEREQLLAQDRQVLFQRASQQQQQTAAPLADKLRTAKLHYDEQQPLNYHLNSYDPDRKEGHILSVPNIKDHNKPQGIMRPFEADVVKRGAKLNGDVDAFHARDLKPKAEYFNDVIDAHESELQRKRRKLMYEEQQRGVVGSTATPLQDMPADLSQYSTAAAANVSAQMSHYSGDFHPDDLSQEPDYKSKVRFLNLLGLETVSRERRIQMDMVRHAVEMDQRRRYGLNGYEQSFKSLHNSAESSSSPLNLKRRYKEETASQGPPPLASSVLKVPPKAAGGGPDHAPNNRAVIFPPPHEVEKSKAFAQAFHASVLQSTKDVKKEPLESADNTHQLQHSPSSSQCSSKVDNSSVFKWPGIEVLLEAYQRHVEENEAEKAVLAEQCHRLQQQKNELRNSAEAISKKMQEFLHNKELDKQERNRIQSEIDNLKLCLNALR